MIKAEYIDHMGSDLSVVNAARVSFAKESGWEVFRGSEDYGGQKPNGERCKKTSNLNGMNLYKRLSDKDRRLINFLARERHELPFAHTAITLRCSAPVPIRTQCFKSKVGFVENEESRRYITNTPELFVPDAFRSAVKDKKQGSGGVHFRSGDWLETYESFSKHCIEAYEEMIADGVCPEQARFILPQGIMVNWIWTGSLLAYSRFCKLRLKTDAQAEVRVMAQQVSDIMAGLYPVSWQALEDAR